MSDTSYLTYQHHLQLPLVDYTDYKVPDHILLLLRLNPEGEKETKVLYM